MVERRIVVELKSIDQISPVHEAVVLTYLKLFHTITGLLINFHVPVLKDGIRRYIGKEKQVFTTAAAEVRGENGEASRNIHD